MLRDDLVPGAVAPVVRRVCKPVLLRGVRDEDDRPLGRPVLLRESARERKRDRDCARVVEGGSEPAVMVTADDRRRHVSAPGQDSDDVRSLRAARQRRRQNDTNHRPCMLLESSGVFFADRHAGRRFGVPDAVERPEGLRRLVVRASGRRRHDHCDSAAQAELQADVIRPEPRDFPVDERHLAADVEAVELPPAACARRRRAPRRCRPRVFREHRRTTRIRSAHRRPARRTRPRAATRRRGPVPRRRRPDRRLASPRR